MLHFPSFANENFSLLRIGYDEKRSVKGMKLCVRLLQVNKEHENKKTNLVKFFQEWTGLRNIKDRRGGNTHFHVDRESKKESRCTHNDISDRHDGRKGSKKGLTYSFSTHSVEFFR